MRSIGVLPEGGFHLHLSVGTEMEDLLGQEKTFKDVFGFDRSQQRSHVTSLANSCPVWISWGLFC